MTVEKRRVEVGKVKCDIKFLLYCKKNNLIPIFTRPKFAIKVNKYSRNKVSRQVLDDEIRNQHVRKTKLTRQLYSKH